LKQQAVPYLTFDGNAKEALDFYKDVFDGEIVEMRTYGEADYPTPPEADERIIHAKFQKGGLLMMVSDSFPGNKVTPGNQSDFPCS
jgi:PhnB protein